MSYNKPLPRLDTTNRPFWDGARQGKLLLQYCKACGDTRFPPSHVCPNCLSSDQDWKQASGKGKLESWVDMHRAYWDGFKGELPYRVCLVRLEEGPVMVSSLVDKTDNLRMGQPVRVVFDAVTDEVTLPKFTVD
jgi:uncharacterized OB-fold protein